MGSHGLWSSEPNAGLKPHVSSPIPDLPSLKESLSLAPNHLGSSHITPTSTLHAHVSFITTCPCRNGSRRSWMTTRSWMNSFTTSAQMTSMTSE